MSVGGGYGGKGPKFGRPEKAVAEVLTRGQFGPKGTLDNVVRVLASDSRWAGRLRYNAFVSEIEQDGVAVTTEGDGEVAIWLDRVYGVVAPTTRVAEGIAIVARRNGYHPVLDWLAGLRWDGVARLDDVLSSCFGAEVTALNRRVGACWLISAVARVKSPGCKVDTSLILVGPQGAKKSSGFRALVGAPWFADTPIAPGSKDAYQGIRGVWMYEFGELDSIKRSEHSAVKAFLSAPMDRYRPSYGRYVITVPRQVVIVGSTNEREFLRDPTGSRRFWPVWAPLVNLAAILEQRDQLWAEAVVRHAAGERWWLEGEEVALLAEVSEDYRESDPWEQPVEAWAKGRSGGFTSSEVLTGPIGKETCHQTRQDEMRIAAVLRTLGYVQSRIQGSGIRRRMWFLSPTAPAPAEAEAGEPADDVATDDPWFGSGS